MYGGTNFGTPACLPAIHRNTYTFLGSVRPWVMELGMTSSTVQRMRAGGNAIGQQFFVIAPRSIPSLAKYSLFEFSLSLVVVQ